jgi:hypothetical protein
MPAATGNMVVGSQPDTGFRLRHLFQNKEAPEPIGQKQQLRNESFLEREGN